MVELQRPETNSEPDEYAIDSNSYQAKAKRINIIDKNGNYIDNENPLPVNSDSVYSSDIWVSESDIGDFSGEITTQSISKYISTNTTTVCKYGSGKITNILILDNAGTITLYDNTAASGTVLGTIDANKIYGSIPTDIIFNNGLTVVTTTGAKLVISYE